MSIERTHPRQPGFGDSAMALDVVMQLTICLAVKWVNHLSALPSMSLMPEHRM